MADWKNLLDCWGRSAHRRVTEQQKSLIAGLAQFSDQRCMSSLEGGQVAATGIQWAVNKILNEGHS